MFEFQPFLKRLKKTAFLVPTLALRVSAESKYCSLP